MTWDTLQREMLAALGHTVYVAADSPALRAADGPPATGPEATQERGRRAPDALLRALLRASNVSEDNLAALQSHLPPLQTLTGNAAAKRALWPALRALRALTGAQ